MASMHLINAYTKVDVIDGGYRRLDNRQLRKKDTAFVLTRTLLPIFLIGGMGVFLSLVFFQFERTTLEQVRSEIFRESQVAASVIKRLYSEKYSSSQSDIEFLANQPTMTAYLDNFDDLTSGISDTGKGVVSARINLEQTFAALLASKASIYQLRVIDVREERAGNELIRVERKGGVVYVTPESSLQNKFNRDYYAPSSNLAMGDVYVSELSLNKELGQIDFPYRPTLRFSVALFNQQQARIGFIIANVDMTIFLEEISKLRAPYGLFMLREANDLFSYHYQTSLHYGKDLNPIGTYTNAYKSEDMLGGKLTALTELFGAKRTLIDYSFEFVTASGNVMTIHLLTKNELIEIRMNDRRQTFYGLLIITLVVFVLIVASVYRSFTKDRALSDAESSSRIKSDFISSVSHEMRTPLNGIVGALTLLEEQPQSADAKKYLAIAITSSNILRTLINDILDLSKIEADKLELLPTRFDPVGLVKNIMNIMSVTRHAKHIRLRLDTTQLNFVVVYADNNRITQVLNNLISNALKFTEQGRVDVSIISEEITPNQGYLHIKVTDTGIGISKENQKKLFQSFSQISNKASTKIRGSGLGLIISQKLCEMMGGDIHMESKLGVGTTVKCSILVEGWLPQSNQEKKTIYEFPEQEVVVPDESTILDKTNPKMKAQQWPHLVGKHVLIVDDNEINVEIARSLLSDMPVDFCTAHDGEVALEVLRKIGEQGDTNVCVLMDCFMPNMDGYEATQAIRDGACGEHMKNVAIVAMTANAMKGDKQKCLDAGMNDYLTKPFSKQVLINMVNKHLSKVITK